MTIRYFFRGRDVFLFSYKWQLKKGFWSPWRTWFCPIHSQAHNVWSAGRACWHRQHAWIAGYHWIAGSKYEQQGNDWKTNPVNIPELIYCQRQRKYYKIQTGKKLCGPEVQMLVFNRSWKKHRELWDSLKKIVVMGERCWIKCVCVFLVTPVQDREFPRGLGAGKG